MKPPSSPSSMPSWDLRLPLLLAAVSTFAAQAQTAKPEFTYPAPSLPAIKLGNPLPEALAPSHTGGEIPNRPYRNVDTFAGSGSAGGNNATGTAATFNGPWGISRDPQGNFYVADFSGKRIRKVTPGGAVSLIDEFGSFEPIATAVDPATGHLYCSIATHRILRYVNKNAANYPAQEPVYGPETNFADSVIVYIGTSSSGTTDASGINARLNAPHALSVHDGFLYIADKGNNRIRKVNLSTAAVETVPLTGGTLDGPEGMLVTPNGTIYVANTNGNDLIQKIENTVVTTYAGSSSGYANGMTASAKFDNPRGLAMDAEGHLYVAEGNNNTIRRISPDGWVTSIAGSTTGGYDASKGFTDAIGDAARFNAPRGLLGAVDGMLYVTDFSNHRIRRLSLTGYEIDPPLPAGLALDPATGVISGTATALTPENGELFPHYQNAFGAGGGTATFHGSAKESSNQLSEAKLKLTTNTPNESGGITIPAGNLNVQELEVSFTLETSKAIGGGQGFSYNFGEGVSGGSTAWPYAESGTGTGLSLTFDPFGETGPTIKGMRLLHGTKMLGSGTTPGLNGVLAYSPNVDWAGKASTVRLSIDTLSRVTVTLDGVEIFSKIKLPPEYVAADKSKWSHALLARTDSAAFDEFVIDDLNIRQPLAGAASYQITARNAVGKSSASVAINVKEAPAIVASFNLKLEEDQPAAMYQGAGAGWQAMPTVDHNSLPVSIFMHTWQAAYTKERAVLAADANCRNFVGIGEIYDPRALEQRFKSRALYRHVAGATTWQRLTAAGDEPWMTVASNADGSVLAAGTYLRTLAGTTISSQPAIVRCSSDSGATWNTYTVPIPNAWVSSIAINGDGSRVYVGLIDGGLLISRDRGTTWQVVNPSSIPEHVVHVSCNFSGETVQTSGGTNGDLYVSNNSGASWTNVPYSYSTYGYATYYGMSGDSSFRFMGTHQGRLNLQTSTGWERVEWPRSNIVPGGMYASSYDAGRFHVMDTGGDLYTTRDRGATWTQTRVAQSQYFPTAGVDYFPKLRTLLTSYRGTRIALVYDGKAFASDGSGIEITHGKGGSQVLTVMLGAPQGFLRVTAPEGVTVAGNGTANLTLTGPLGLINATLESLTYQGGADFTGAAGFTITASASGVSTSETSELTVQDAAQPEMAAQATSAAVAQTTATLGGTVLADGGSAITRRGVVISPTLANPSPVRGGVEVIDLAATGTSLGAFTVNATGLLAGTSYSFRAYAMNANGPQYSDVGTFKTSGGSNTTSPLASWRQQHFGTTENTGNAADLATPDGDGVTNLMKYALGLTPGQNASGSLPKGKIAASTGNRYLSLSLRRDPSRTDVTIVVEVISSLGGSWTEIARSVNGAAFTGTAGVTEVDAGDGTKNVEIRDTQTVGSSLRRFMRVRAER